GRRAMAARATVGDLLRQRSLPAQRAGGADGRCLGLSAGVLFPRRLLRLATARFPSGDGGGYHVHHAQRPGPLSRGSDGAADVSPPASNPGGHLPLRYQAKAMISAMVRYSVSGISSPSSRRASSFTSSAFS